MFDYKKLWWCDKQLPSLQMLSSANFSRYTLTGKNLSV